MPAIKVRAVDTGIYMGKKYVAGQEFILVDQINSLTGKVIQSAEASLSERGVVRGGWMVRVVPKKQEDPAVTLERELAQAQAAADLKAKEIAEAGLSDIEKEALAHGATTTTAPKVGMGVQGLGSDAKDNAHPTPAPNSETKKPSEVL